MRVALLIGTRLVFRVVGVPADERFTAPSRARHRAT